MSSRANAASWTRRSRTAAPWPAAFYDRGTAEVARDLLGCTLESTLDDRLVRGRIVEVEAYLGPHDPACHAAVGLTERNRHLHGPPGTVYVYRIYGMHWCVNAVTREAGHGSAVLIRALSPVYGVEHMQERRGHSPGGREASLRGIANGPGKLCQALGITGAHSGTRFDRAPLRILRPGGDEALEDAEVVVTPRIGITQAADWPLRFLIAGESHVSATPRAFARRSVGEAISWLADRGLR